MSRGLFGIALSLGLIAHSALASSPPLRPPHGTLVLFQDSTSPSGTELEVYRWDAFTESFVSIWSHRRAAFQIEFQFQASSSGNSAVLLEKGKGRMLFHIDLTRARSVLKQLPIYAAQALSAGSDGSILVSTRSGGIHRIDDKGFDTQVVPPGSLKLLPLQSLWSHFQEIAKDQFVAVSETGLSYLYFDRSKSDDLPQVDIALDSIPLAKGTPNQSRIASVEQIAASPDRVWMKVKLISGTRGLIALETKTGNLQYENFSKLATLEELLSVDTSGRLIFGQRFDLLEIDAKGTPLRVAKNFFLTDRLRSSGIIPLNGVNSALASYLSWSWPQFFPANTPKVTAAPPVPVQKIAEARAPFQLPASFTARELRRMLSPYSPIEEQAPADLRELMDLLTEWELRALGLEPYGRTYDLVPGKESQVISGQSLQALLSFALDRAQKKQAQCASALSLQPL